MSEPFKPIPEFASEAEKSAFWESLQNDCTEYVDWSKAKLVTFPKLRLSAETISLRMPEDLLNTIRSHPRRLNVPYQSQINSGARRRSLSWLPAARRGRASYLPPRVFPISAKETVAQASWSTLVPYKARCQGWKFLAASALHSI
jgi:predicted DNA binding CopG/RHH family protein